MLQVMDYYLGPNGVLWASVSGASKGNGEWLSVQLVSEVDVASGVFTP